MKINLTECFDKTAERFPNKTAIIDNERTIDYSSLLNKTKKLATVIQKLVLNDNTPVAVLLPKSIECVIADIGILYSGHAYMNLNIKDPMDRISAILKAVHPSVIIAASEYEDRLQNIDSKIIIMDQVNWDDIYYDDEQLKINRGFGVDTDLSCIINTSGSTGIPKSVALNHRSFFDFVDWAIDSFHFKDDDIIGSLSPSVFDIYSFELCLLMVCGSTLVIIPDYLAAFPVKILQLLDKEKVTFIFWVPTIMVNIANMGLLERACPQSLKCIWFAGEVFPTKQLNVWRKYLPATIFVNMYGPIEITLDCSFYVVDRQLQDDEPIPIGKACRNTSIILLTDNNEEARLPGVEGEICVRGTSLAMGYYNNPEKTKEAFVQNPLNSHYPELIYRTGDIAYYNELGELIFKGRKDTLIKHFGYRIELMEIEHVIIDRLKLVNNCCAVYQKEKQEIVLCYESEEDIAMSEWRQKLSAVLPHYMVPKQYIRFDLMPCNTNGKIDRLKLKKMISS